MVAPRLAETTLHSLRSAHCLANRSDARNTTTGCGCSGRGTPSGKIKNRRNPGNTWKDAEPGGNKWNTFAAFYGFGGKSLLLANCCFRQAPAGWHFLAGWSPSPLLLMLKLHFSRLHHREGGRTKAVHPPPPPKNIFSRFPRKFANTAKICPSNLEFGGVEQHWPQTTKKCCPPM